MRPRRNILILEIITFLVVFGIIIWQINIIPGLQEQIKSGLRYNLEKIADGASQGFSHHYRLKVTDSHQSIIDEYKSVAFEERNLKALKSRFLITASTQPLFSSWLVAFPDRRKKRFKVYEYKKPSRFRLEGDLSGSWRRETELSGSVSAELENIMESYDDVNDFSANYWRNAIDSTITFVYNRDFESAPIIGTPVFDKETEGLKGLVFSLTDVGYVEHVLISNYFNYNYWQGTEKREGIDKKHLQIGVRSGRNDQLVYQSVAFGKEEFEHFTPVKGVPAALLDLEVGVGFRNTSVDSVAQSIYNRNLYLIGGLLATLLLMLLLIFRTIRKANKLSRMKSDFIANVSHEIKTPLASIRLANDTLRLRRASSPEQQEMITKIIHDETERLEYLIRTILDFSQLEAGEKKYKKEALSAEELVSRVREVSRQKALIAGFDLTINEKDIYGQLEVDALAIEQVIVILIDNAIKYSSDKKKVHLTIGCTRKRLRIAVRDYGIGISKEDQDQIFERFVRIGNSDVHNVKGYGIGLSIGKTIVEDHNGKIGVKSTEGKGSTFFIILPLKLSHESKT